MQMSEKNYREMYEWMTRPFVGHPGRILTLKMVGRFLVGFMYVAYPFLLLRVYSLTRSLLHPLLLKLFWVPALSFVVLSVFRHRINRPRPYEAHAIHPLIPRDKQGESMPSRHVFSAAVISMCWMYVMPKVGAFFLFLTLISGAVRVLAGVHYPSDVAVGFDLGVLSGLLLWIVR